MAFDNVRLREDIETGARGGPRFKTTIVTAASGQEQRVSEWVYERSEFDISYGVQNKEDYQAILDFFRARRGKHRGFRFKDWADYEAFNEVIGTGDDEQRTFQLVKNYDNVLYTRKITRPVVGTVTITLDGTPKATGFSVDHSTGVVTFTNDPEHIPGDGVIVRASFEFDLPVRFDTDQMAARLVWADAGRIPEVPVVELLE